MALQHEKAERLIQTLPAGRVDLEILILQFVPVDSSQYLPLGPDAHYCFENEEHVRVWRHLRHWRHLKVCPLLGD